jgi:hypothetical protein
LIPRISLRDGLLSPAERLITSAETRSFSSHRTDVVTAIATGNHRIVIVCGTELEAVLAANGTGDHQGAAA